jgi:hypothetical protein
MACAGFNPEMARRTIQVATDSLENGNSRQSPSMPLLSVPDVFGNVLPLETQLCSQLSRCSDTAERKIVISVAEGMDPTIRGVFLRWLFTEALLSTGLPIARLEIEGASIIDVLDLEGLNIRFLLSFVACDFRDKIKLVAILAH